MEEYTTKRILQVMTSLNCGGAENMVMNIYRNINRDKIQFDFVVHTNGKDFFEDEVKKLGGHIYKIPRYKLYNHLKYTKKWNVFLKEHPEYKIVHCHNRSVASIIMKIAKKYGCITISHSHSISNGNGIKSLIKKKYQKKITRYADYLFACSKKASKWLFGDKSSSSNCFIINNAIDVDKYLFNIKKRKIIRDSFGLINEIAIVQVGRLYDMKNHVFTLNLIEKLKDNMNVKLFIIGDGQLRQYLENIVKEKGISNNVVFLGLRNDIYDLLQGMDIFIMPSLYEGLPLALVEAQASSLPCIISNKISSGIINEKLVDVLVLDDIPGWIRAIQNRINYQRFDQSDIIKDNGFDVKNNAKWLQKFYLKILNGEEKL